MSDTLKNAAETLRNTQAGWVTRRDAADLLGRLAHKALAALEAHREDPDVDVRRAVHAALEHRSRPADVREMDEADPRSFDDLARSCAKPGAREIEAVASGYRVTVALPDGRVQRVYLNVAQRNDGPELVCVQTRCGTPDERTKQWALRNNTKLAHCAFALDVSDSVETLLLVNNIDRRLATPDAVKAAVKEMAYYGDWIEQKLTGLDEL